MIWWHQLFYILNVFAFFAACSTAYISYLYIYVEIDPTQPFNMALEISIFILFFHFFGFMTNLDEINTQKD